MKIGDVPVGTIVMWPGMNTDIPEGWLECDGRMLNRKQYQQLYQVVKENFGVTRDQNDQFYLPDLRGQFIRGYDKSGVRDPDHKSRTDMQNPTINYDGVGSIQPSALQTHTHEYTQFPNGRGAPIAGGDYWQSQPNQTGIPVGCNISSKETRPTNAYLVFIIRVRGINDS